MEVKGLQVEVVEELLVHLEELLYKDMLALDQLQDKAQVAEEVARELDNQEQQDHQLMVE